MKRERSSRREGKREEKTDQESEKGKRVQESEQCMQQHKPLASECVEMVTEYMPALALLM